MKRVASTFLFLLFTLLTFHVLAQKIEGFTEPYEWIRQQQVNANVKQVLLLDSIWHFEKGHAWTSTKKYITYLDQDGKGYSTCIYDSSGQKESSTIHKDKGNIVRSIDSVFRRGYFNHAYISEEHYDEQGNLFLQYLIENDTLHWKHLNVYDNRFIGHDVYSQYNLTHLYKDNKEVERWTCEYDVDPDCEEPFHTVSVYDSLGRIWQQRTYFPKKYLETEGTKTYYYHPTGRIDSIVYRSNSQDWKNLYYYDDQNRLLTLQQWHQNKLKINIVLNYDAKGRITYYKRDYGEQYFEYGPDGLLKKVKVLINGKLKGMNTYDYVFW